VLSQRTLADLNGPRSLSERERVLLLQHSPFCIRRRKVKMMASGHFDELTKNLATSTSRRQAFKAIFVGALGGALGLGSLGQALATSCKSIHASCVHDSECCSHDCYYAPQQQFSGNCGCSSSGHTCSSNGDCCSGLHCSNGKCKK
jgi:hypothetical protein